MVLAIALTIGFLSNIAHSSEISFKGYMVGEYYYVINHNSGSVDAGGIEGRHGFWFRRIYFTTNMTLTDSIKGRLRLEMNSPGGFPFDSKSTLTPAVKDAYLSYKTGDHSLMFGIISTPTFGHNVEDIWGYRSVEKTPLDLYKMASSRDFGVGAKGALDKGKTINYFVLFGNGASNKGETNKGKKLYASLAFKPIEGLTLELYGDYEDAGSDKTYYVYQGFGAYQGDWGRIGVLYARRHYKEEGTPDIKYDYDVISGFVVIKATKDLDVIARYDRMFGDGFENNFSGDGISYIPFASDPGAAFNLVIAGVSWQAAKGVYLIPNVRYVFYGEPEVGSKPSEDLYANFTVWFKF